MIELLDVTKEFPVGESSIRVLSHISLSIKEAEFVGILGASGSGKSTLMYIMGLLDQPTKGDVRIEHRSVLRLSDNELSLIRNRSIGFVFQQFHLIQNMTVYENILLPSLYARSNGNDYSDRAMHLLTHVGLGHRKDFYPNRISGGEQQRVAIARSLMMNPKIVLADEPTGNLDSKTGAEILDLLASLRRDFRTTVVVVTHNRDVAKRTDRKLFLKDGVVVAHI